MDFFEKNESLKSSLQWRRILGKRVQIFVLSHHLGFACPPFPALCPKALLVKHPITIQDGCIENLLYQAFHFKIMPALQTDLNLFESYL